jgi:diguanylate cyclase (GGDEF)-like protein
VSDDRDRRELEVLYRLALTLPNSLTVTGVTDNLAVELVGAIERADACTISSWEQPADELQVLSDFNLRDGIDETWRGVRYKLADWPQDRAVLESAEMREYRRDDPQFNDRQRALFDEWNWRRWLVFPLIVENRPVGLIHLVDSSSDAPWSLSDRRFCATVGAQAALAVRNAQLYEDLRRQVDHDALTGLLNHAAFYGRVDEELARIARGGRPAAVLAIDLDDFKAINDRDGHLAGDETLRRVAAALRAVCRDADVAGRMGGDEFCVLLVDTSGDPLRVADRLTRLLSMEAGVTASVGVAVTRPDDREAAAVIDRADRALLDAKRAGKRTARRSA